MIVVIDNTKEQKTKMFLPKLIEYLNSVKIPYTIVDGSIEGIRQLKQIPPHAVQGIILSGSPLMFNDRLKQEHYQCNIYCLQKMKHVPILGICFGCQFINTYFGGTLHDTGAVHCQKYNITTIKRAISAKFCCRYVLENVPHSKLQVMALMQFNDGKMYPCAIKHKRRHIYGTLFHPEALESTKWILDAFLKICQVRI